MTVFAIVALSLTVFLASAGPVDKEKIREAAKQLLVECKSASGATNSDLENLSVKKMPQSREGLCMLECVLSSLKIMENGKFSRDGFIGGLRPLAADEEKLKNLENFASICEKEIGAGGEDKCQNAKLLVECITKNAKSHGFETR